MISRHLYKVLVIILFFTIACSDNELEKKEWLHKGAEILKPFKKELKEALQSGLSKGPISAIDICKIEAPKIAAKFSSDGITIGRTSHKFRNPANKPQQWTKSLLDEYLKNPDNTDPQVVIIDDDHIGYIEPIFIKPICLTCHGEYLDQSLSAIIDKQYPQDKARGYINGSFRGIFWVEFTLEDN